MAKAKKSEAALTLEEKLEQALIADEEQPYKVPENWCWTNVKYIAEVVTGGTPSKKHPEYYGSSFPFFKPADLDAGRHVCEASEYLSEEGKLVSRIIPAKSTAVCCIGSIGKCGFLDIGGTTNQQINSAIPKINALYLYYYLNTDSFVNQLWEKVSATTISIVNKSKMEQCFVPLSPIAEQQRIVDRIERMFSKLDEVKENVQNVIDGFENRKSAILHKAFNGELTAKWRKENGISFASWGNVVMDDVCVINPPKLNTKDLDDNLKVSFVPMASLSEIYGEIIDSQIRLLKDVKSGFTSFKEGDVVFAKITPCMENGKCAIVGKLVNNIGYGTTEFYVFRCGEKLFNRYLYHILRHKSFRDKAKAEMTGAVGQQRVPKSFLQKYSLYLPSYDEQIEIVRILDNILLKQQQAKEKAEEVLEKIELIKKSILARAFRGELGTNNPDEESSLELLKMVLSEDKDEKRVTKPKSKRVSIPVEVKAMLSNHLEKDILKLFYKAESNEVSIDDIMSVSSNKFELMDALKALEEKKLVSKKANGIYKLAR